MKKFSQLFSLIMMATVSLSLCSCGEDDLDTNQYAGGFSLNAYGPNPCTRGGVLRFVGSNLDQTASVSIPGVDPMTNFEIKRSGVPSEIWVTVPKDGPEPGKVTLTAKDGTILTTPQNVYYQEGVEFTSFSPATVMPGDTLTISGEYLYLINMVEFSEGVRVSKDDFISQDRYTIKVSVPDSARTGKVNLYTVDLTTDPDNDEYEVFESEDALEVGTASVTSVASPRGTAEAQGTLTAKAGETITITGNYFNLVSSIKTGDASGSLGEYEFSDFQVSDDGKTLTFTLPDKATDGDINLVCRSGVEVPVGTLVTVAPSNLKASPSPVKNGGQLTITGSDLDVVESVTLPNVSGSVDAVISASSIVIRSVPAAAQEGYITLTMKNGKTATVAYTLVKPVVTAYSPSTVSAGAALTVTGTNLDLVESLTFKGSESTSAVSVSDDGTSLTTTVPMDAQTGDVTLNLKNGSTVTASSIAIAEAVFCYVTELPTKDNAPDAGGTLTVPVKNADKLIAVYVNGTQVNFVYNTKASTLTIAIPSNAKVTSSLKLVSSNGSVTYTIPVNSDIVDETTIWEGSLFFGGWANALQDLSWGGYDWSKVKSGTTLKIYFTEDASSTYWQLRIAKGDGWVALSGTSGDYNLESGATSFSYQLSADDLTELVNGGGLILCGSYMNLTKVVLIEP
jgi:hypothetical protein